MINLVIVPVVIGVTQLCRLSMSSVTDKFDVSEEIAFDLLGTVSLPSAVGCPNAFENQ